MRIESNNINISPPDDSTWANEKALTEALKRTVVVHSDIFSELVNSGLEVRTAVAINPETGAAEHGALFTYEAIPRATFLTSGVVIDDYRIVKPWPVTKTNSGENLEKQWNSPKGVVESGCQLLEYLGIGGMGTRGFGRISKSGDKKTGRFGEKHSVEICWSPGSNLSEDKTFKVTEFGLWAPRNSISGEI